MSLRNAIRQLARDYHAGGHLALLFDYDGTLAPIVIHPDLAQLPGDTRKLLERLTTLPRLTVGIVSGRSLAGLKALVTVPKVIYAGTCGLEIDLPDGIKTHSLTAAHRTALGDAAADLERAISWYPGGWLERKPLGLTVHFRAVSRENAPFLRQAVNGELLKYRGSLIATDACVAVEVLPDVGWNKGRTVELILDRCPQPPGALYAGNDENDASALEFVNRLGGVAIGVGPYAPPCVRYRLTDPEQLVQELGILLASLQSPDDERGKFSETCPSTGGHSKCQPEVPHARKMVE